MLKVSFYRSNYRHKQLFVSKLKGHKEAFLKLVVDSLGPLKLAKSISILKIAVDKPKYRF